MANTMRHSGRPISSLTRRSNSLRCLARVGDRTGVARPASYRRQARELSADPGQPLTTGALLGDHDLAQSASDPTVEVDRAIGAVEGAVGPGENALHQLGGGQRAVQLGRALPGQVGDLVERDASTSGAGGGGRRIGCVRRRHGRHAAVLSVEWGLPAQHHEEAEHNSPTMSCSDPASIVHVGTTVAHRASFTAQTRLWPQTTCETTLRTHRSGITRCAANGSSQVVTRVPTRAGS